MGGRTARAHRQEETPLMQKHKSLFEISTHWLRSQSEKACVRTVRRTKWDSKISNRFNLNTDRSSSNMPAQYPGPVDLSCVCVCVCLCLDEEIEQTDHVSG